MSGGPNIIVVLADDLGYGDLGCYGATQVDTPNLDRLAAEGVRMTDAHSPAALCTPSRYGLLTGRYCWRSRLKTANVDVNDPLLIEAGRLTLPGMLKAAGYTTGCVGKWHLGFGETGPDWNGELKPGPLEVGFDYYFGVPTSHNWPPFAYVENHRIAGKRDDEVIVVTQKPRQEVRGIAARRVDDEIARVQTAKAVEFIERHRDEPFFLYFASCNVHQPYAPAPQFRGTSRCGIYGDFIHEFDWSVGEVMRALDRFGLTENTLLIVTSDHGAVDRFRDFGHRACGPLRGQKADVWEGGHRVPFVARWPGRIPAGLVSGGVICHTDLFATCAGIAGAGIPDDTAEDSWDVLPLLTGEADGSEAPFATRGVVHHSRNGLFALRQGPWKAIFGRGSGGWDWPERHEPPRPGEPLGQLYNMADDIGETRNLWSEQPERVAAMRALFDDIVAGGRSRP